jgi:hypothetical protein
MGSAWQYPLVWEEENVRAAIDYVLHGQGEDMEVYRGPLPWT